jgi:hypothetical protein
MVRLVGNLDLLRSAAPKDAHNKGSRPGDAVTRACPLTASRGCQNRKRRGEERSGATLGEAGECFAVNKDAALAVD